MKKNITTLFLFYLLFTLACESTPETQRKAREDIQDTSDTENSKTDTGYSTGEWQNQPAEDIPDMPQMPVCRKKCSSVDDCVEVGANALHQPMNYACTNGICYHKGCQSDANCDEQYPGLDYLCSTNGECLKKCAAPSDCVRANLFPGDHEMTENNFECQAGGCRWIGCVSHEECHVSFGPGSVCWDTYGVGIKECSYKCNPQGDLSECVTSQENPAYSAENYNCIIEACFYTGCKNDEECGDGYACVKPD